MADANKIAAGSMARRRVYESPIAGRSAFDGVVDSLIVQCGNAGSIDLNYGGGHSLIEAGLPELLFEECATFKGRADTLGSIAESRIEHLGTPFRVKVEVTVCNDGCKVLRWFGSVRSAADRGATESEEAGGQNRDRSDGLSFDHGFHGYLLV